MDTLEKFLKRFRSTSHKGKLAPIAFIGHGNPMNAIEDNSFSRTWRYIGQQIPKPKAIVVISAHWQTEGTWITAMENPKTIHDYYGFPTEMYQQNYPAAGEPGIAKIISENSSEIFSKDYDWGLDHGTWSVLKPMFPEADIPVVQVSLDISKSADGHFKLAKELMILRTEGIMVIGSGNIVHNLSMMKFSENAYDWAIEFDEKVKERINLRNFLDLVNLTRT